MKKFLLTTTAILGLIASAAAATSVADQVIAGLQAQGFDRIEIVQGPSQLKVEAIRGTTKLEIIYDLATGAVLKQETETVVAGDDTTPGIEIDTTDGDFIEVTADDSTDDSADDSVEEAAELADDAEDAAAEAADDAEDAADQAADYADEDDADEYDAAENDAADDEGGYAEEDAAEDESDAAEGDAAEDEGGFADDAAAEDEQDAAEVEQDVNDTEDEAAYDANAGAADFN